MKKFISLTLIVILTCFALYGQSSPINPVSLRYYIENIHFTKFRTDSLTVDDFATFGDSVFVDTLVANYLTVNDSAYIDTMTIGTKIIPDANNGASIGESALQFLNIYAQHIDGDTVFVGVWGQNIDANQKMVTDLGTLATDSVISNSGNLKVSGAGTGIVENTDSLQVNIALLPDANDGAMLGTNSLNFAEVNARQGDFDSTYVGVLGENIDADQKMISDLGTLKTDSVTSNSGNLKLSGLATGVVEIQDTLDVDYISNSAAIEIRASGDNNDYIDLSATSDLPQIRGVGGADKTDALKITTDDGNLLISPADSVIVEKPTMFEGQLLKKNVTTIPSSIPSDRTAITSYDDGSTVHIMATKDDNATETQVKLAEQSSVTNLSARGVAYFGNGTDQYISFPDNANLRFGTGNFGLIFKDVNLPDYTPSAAVTIARKANTTDNLGLIITVETDGKPQVAFGNGSNFTTLVYKSANAISTSDGQRMHLGVSVTRETASAAGSVNFYEMNQNVWRLLSSVTITAGTPQTVTETNLSALVLFQNINGTTEYAFNSLGEFLPLNHAPTMDEVKSYIEYGVPYKYKGASQTDILTGEGAFGVPAADIAAFNAAYTMQVTLGGTSTIVVDAVNVATIVNINAGNSGSITLATGLVVGKVYRISNMNISSVVGTWRLGTTHSYSGGTAYTTYSTTGNKELIFTAVGTSLYLSNLSSGTIVFDQSAVTMTLTQIGCPAEYLPEGFGHYSCLDQSGNEGHGTVSGALPFGLNIGDRRTAYLSTTSETPTMTDVIKGGWKVLGLSFASAQNLTVIDATQETSSIKLIDGKTVNNGILICDTIADHLAYEPGTDKDIVFTLTGNGGAGTVIKVVLEKVK